MTQASPRLDVPHDVAQVFERFFATEYTYFTPKGEPLCWPVSPYWYPDRGVLAIATGLAYPNKAEYPKRNPKVGLLFSDPIFSGLTHPPTVLVQGDATVIDDDIQANTDRYVREMRHKFPLARLGLNTLSVKFLDFYLPRLWVEITPVRVLVWSQGTSKSSGGPEVIGRDLVENPSPEAPATKLGDPTVNLKPLEDWVRRCKEGVVAVRGSDGYPSMTRTAVRIDAGVIRLDESPGTGPAALTFHYARLGGVRFNSLMVRGFIEPLDEQFVFQTRRIVGLFGERESPVSVFPRIAQLRRNLRAELERRGQPMPKLRVPR